MAFQSLIGAFIELPVPMQVTIAVLGLAAVQQFRQGHIGRVGIASAGAVVFAAAYPIWNTLSGIWRAYTGVVMIFAAIAGLSYLTKTSLSSEFYKVALVLLGGLPVILVLVYGFPL